MAAEDDRLPRSIRIQDCCHDRGIDLSGVQQFRLQTEFLEFVLQKRGSLQKVLFFAVLTLVIDEVLPETQRFIAMIIDDAAHLRIEFL